MAGSPPPQGYAGSIPVIAQAFQNDPRTKLAQSMVAQGTSTAPVAQGGWGVTDGIARALSGVAGAYTNKKTEEKYSTREAAYTKGLQDAATALSGQTPAQVAPPDGLPQAANPAAQAVPSAPPPFQPAPGMVPGNVRSTPILPSGPPGFTPPGIGMQPPGIGGGRPGMQQPPRPTDGGTGQQPVGAPQPNAAQLFAKGIVPIEGGTGNGGQFLTSPKGAIGPAQVMPGTAPEAAALAGVPYDERLYKTDTAYNLKIGQAYYAKQLADFGDPVKAAAAYNAGPGRVRRAVRTGNRTGTDWTSHIPAETQQYVQNFAAKIGSGDTPQQALAAPQQEAIPELPADVARPNAPAVPDEVKSRRVAAAQQLLSSGNPDLVSLAQEYLDKGADEQFNAAQVRNGQQFQREGQGYEADLQDFTGSRSDRRRAAYADRQAAQDRNFGRETTANAQDFTAGQQEKQNSFSAQQADVNRNFERSQATTQFGRQLTLQQLAIEGKRLTDSEKRNAKQTEFFRTPQGNKMYTDATSKIAANDATREKAKQFLASNEKITGGTGGVRAVVPDWLQSMFSTDAGNLSATSKDLTLGKLGGSLGVAISDGDRKFIQDSTGGLGATHDTNVSLATHLDKALQRANDYEISRLNAFSDGNEKNFPNEWNLYKNAVSIAKDDAPTFDEWKSQNTVKYDAKGKQIK